MHAYYGGMDPDEMEGVEYCCVGTPEFVANELRGFAEAGGSTLILRSAGADQRQRIALCTEHVIPALGIFPDSE